MKLEFVEVEGFRGFRQQIRFVIPTGFAVIVGRNGIGKSTILDAIDFALTGSINKYDVEKAKGGGLLEHIWWVGEGSAKRYYVKVGFIDEAGNRKCVTRFRDEQDAEGLSELLGCLYDAKLTGKSPVSGAALMDTTLIRDEFISASSLDLPGHQRFDLVKEAIGSLSGQDYSTRTGKVLSEAKVALAREQERLDIRQRELGRSLSLLTDARTEASLSSDVAEAIKLVNDAVPGQESVASAKRVRELIANLRVSFDSFNRARTQAVEIANERAYVTSEAFGEELSNAEQELQREIQLLEGAREVERAAYSLLEVEQKSDILEAHFAALLDHGSAVGLQDGHCPLCDAVRSHEEFSEALAAIEARLAGRGKRLADANTVLENAQASVQKSQNAVDALLDTISKLRIRRSAVEEADKTIRRQYDDAGFREVHVSDVLGAERRAAEEQQRIISLERAASILGASTAVARISNFDGQVTRSRELIEVSLAAVANAQAATEAARRIDSAAKEIPNEILVEQFETVLPLLKELYQRLRPHTDWTEIDADFGGKIRGSLNFSVGNGRNPQFLFSSGQRRAAGLAFLLAVHLSRPWCRWNSLLLDDPVQHVDDYRALNLVEVLAAIRRSGRQVVVAVEDVALADLLCRRLRSSTLEPGRRYELTHASDGSAEVKYMLDVSPLPADTLPLQFAS